MPIEPESRPIVLTVNGITVRVAMGATVAAAIAQAGVATWRRSPTGEPRAPLCGIGVCFQCCVSIDGRTNVRSCQVRCRNGMDVRTDA